MASKNPNETVAEESRYNILQDALNQSSQKIINNILRYTFLTAKFTF